MSEFKPRTAIVTGSDSGIGRATAVALAEAGMDIGVTWDLDVAGAEDTAAEVKASGEPVSLDPMTPFERKIVHDAVAAAGLRSESEGVEPRRYVVVLPAD